MLFSELQIYSWGSQSSWDCYLWKIPLSRSHSMIIANSYLCQCMCAHMKGMGKRVAPHCARRKILTSPDFHFQYFGVILFLSLSIYRIFLCCEKHERNWPTKLIQINYIVDQYMSEGILGLLYIFYLITSLHRERESPKAYILHMLSSVLKGFYIFVHSSCCA